MKPAGVSDHTAGWQRVFRRVAFLAAIAEVVIIPRSAWAQSNVEVNAGIQFDFLSPGGRSLALGGAFTAAADDATAAFTNPAGLREISRKEVSFEGRIRSYDTPFTSSGHGMGTPTGVGTDTVTGLVDDFSHQTIGSPSFFSMVYPSGKWRIAAYGHQLARFKSDITTEGAYYGTTNPPSRLLPTQANLDLTVWDYGVSGSLNLSKQATIGAGVVIYKASLDSLTTRYDLPTNTSPPVYTTVRDSQTQTASANNVGFNVGFTVEPADAVRIAAVYRRGAAFDVAVKNLSPTGQTTESGTGQFHVPDVFSLGVAARATRVITVSADFTHVRYSQMTDGFLTLFASSPLTATVAADYSVKDGNEVHGGVQYFDPNAKAPIAVRGGIWYDPAHAIVYGGSNAQFQILFRERDQSQVHYAFGGGVTVPGSSVEINAGVDISKLVTTTSISAIVRF
jgi:long-subunit fatty acid transport protein